MYQLQQCPRLLAHIEVIQSNNYWRVQSYGKVSIYKTQHKGKQVTSLEERESNTEDEASTFHIIPIIVPAPLDAFECLLYRHLVCSKYCHHCCIHALNVWVRFLFSVVILPFGFHFNSTFVNNICKHLLSLQ